MRLAKSKKMDMLNGSLWNKILIFALPIALSSILQQLFNSADLAIVGQFAGHGNPEIASDAVAAVGSNSHVINLLINLFLGLSVGANVVIGNFLGQKKNKEIHEAVHTTISLSLISGIILLIAGFFSARPILYLMGSPVNVIDNATLYLRIYFLGMPFIMVYNFGSAILRSKGDTKRPLICLFTSGILNVLLNYIFVALLHWDVTGVALATLISNILCGLMILYFLTHEDSEIKLNLKKLCINKTHFIKMIKIGVPAGLQGVVFNFSNVVIQSAINMYGSNGMAGSAAALNYEYFTFFVVGAFNQASVSFTSQNFAAGNIERCKKIYRYCLISSLAIVQTMVLFFIIFRHFFIGIYTKNPESIEFGLIRLMVVEGPDILIITYELAASTLRAMGHSLLPAIETIFGVCVLRGIWSIVFFNYFFPNFEKLESFKILMAIYPITWVVTGTILLTTFFTIRKKEFRKILSSKAE